jgi:hypothetical protein
MFLVVSFNHALSFAIKYLEHGEHYTFKHAS